MVEVVDAGEGFTKKYSKEWFENNRYNVGEWDGKFKFVLETNGDFSDYELYLDSQPPYGSYFHPKNGNTLTLYTM